MNNCNKTKNKITVKKSSTSFLTLYVKKESILKLDSFDLGIKFVYEFSLQKKGEVEKARSHRWVMS